MNKSMEVHYESDSIVVQPNQIQGTRITPRLSSSKVIIACAICILAMVAVTGCRRIDPGVYLITYKVTLQDTIQASIDYKIPASTSASLKIDSPSWEKDFLLIISNAATRPDLFLIVQNRTSSGQVTCQIFWAGELMDSNTSSSLATCEP